jgi:hypothetical protein
VFNHTRLASWSAKNAYSSSNVRFTGVSAGKIQPTDAMKSSISQADPIACGPMLLKSEFWILDSLGKRSVRVAGTSRFPSNPELTGGR